MPVGLEGIGLERLSTSLHLHKNYLSADVGVLSFSTAAMLLWQEAGVSAVLLGSKCLNAVYSGLIVIYVSFGAWSALAEDSFLSLVVSILTMYATYVSSLPVFP